jgi:aminoglycoside phosphotransferase (APT) family kinase protein
MRHGYTNRTDRRGGTVRKTYDGPDAEGRCAAETRAITALRDVLPVPAVISTSSRVLTTAYVAGDHGQELIDAGRADAVLAACGALLRRLHELDPTVLATQPGVRDGVISHGDYGPNNILFERGTMTVAAIVDWEFCTIAAAVEDIAWCEWIVRMHHHDAVQALPAFFDAYGSTPPWDARRRAMLNRCNWFAGFCERREPGGAGVQQWRSRSAVTARWTQ